MKNLEIDLKLARTLYPESIGAFKALLQDRFGDKPLQVNIIDQIKNWEDAANIAGIDPIRSLPFTGSNLSSRQKAANAFFKLDVIAEVLREGIVLDWANDNQQKWYSWFNNYSTGAGFSFGASGFGWSYARAGGGARLCVDTQEKAKYFATQFLDIFNEFLNPLN